MVTLRQGANLISLSLIIIVGIIANAMSLNGHTTGEIADSVPTWTTPAAYAFGIWSVIYALLAAFVVYQARPGQRDNQHIQQIGRWFLLSCAANLAWIILWHHQHFTLTVIAMVVLLLSLISIYTQLNIGIRAVSSRDRWFVNVPFSFYLGWVSIATVANISVALANNHWNGSGLADDAWAMIMMGIIASLAVTLTLIRNDYAYALVTVWGLIGMFSRQDNTTLVAYAALAFAAIVTIIACLRFVNTYLWDANAPLCRIRVTEHER